VVEQEQQQVLMDQQQLSLVEAEVPQIQVVVD
jgi:hypothetical protein